MKLATQLTLILVSAILVAVLAMGAFVAMNLERGFVGYINSLQIRHLDALVKTVTLEAERVGNLDPFRDRRLWNRFLRETEDGNVPRDMAELRRPPPFERRGPPPEALEGERRGPPPDRFEPERRPPPGPGPFKGPDGRPPDPLGLGRQFLLLDMERRPIHDGPLPPVGQRAPVERPIVVSGNTLGYIRLYSFERASRPEDLAFLRAQFFDIVIVAGALLVLGIAVAPLVARRWSRPLREIGVATEKIAKGEFGVRVGEGGGDEIGALAKNVNAMGASLGELEAARKRWIAESAHELRTPLAVLRGEIEALQDGVRTFDSKALASLAEEARHLTKLVNDLHLLALADIGGLPCVMTRTDLGTLARRAAGRFASRASERGLALRSSIPDEPVMIEADDDRIDQLLDNLLENSLRYTDRPGTVEVSVSRAGGAAQLVVQDSAPGVRSVEHAKIFEPLYRADVARTRREGGSGLGLAICGAIVKAHGGKISAQASPLGGLAVTVSFPLR